MHEAVILAGGYGTRLRQVVSDVPKPMAPIQGRPFLELQLSMLERQVFVHVVLAVGYLGHMIVSHFGERFGTMALSYTIEDSPLGTGGAIQTALRSCQQDRVFVLNGDTYLEFDCNAADRLWQAARPARAGSPGWWKRAWSGRGSSMRAAMFWRKTNWPASITRCRFRLKPTTWPAFCPRPPSECS